MRFFDDQTITEEREPDTETVQASLVPREAPPADIERAFVSSAVRLKLPENNGRRAQEKVEALAWQSAAWSAYDRIGEVKFAAGMIGQVVSRMRLYAGVVDDPRRAPVTADDYVKQLADDVVAEDTRAAMTFADEIVHDLRINSQAGSLGAMLRMAAINIWIAGEMFLIRDKGKWRVASVKELTRSGNGRGAGYSLRKGRESRSGTMDLDPQSFIARIWRQHPAISGEPDSSMLGALDDCVDDQTEILTDNGWRTEDQVEAGDTVLTLNHDTGLAEWQPIMSMARHEVVDEEMFRFEGKLHDSLTTAGHRWPVLTKAGRRWTTSEKFPMHGKVTLSAPVVGLPTEPKYTDSFVELVAWWWTEGTSQNRDASWRPTLSLSQSERVNPQNVASIRSALTGSFGPKVDKVRGIDGPAWRERTPRVDGVIEFYLNAEAGETVTGVCDDVRQKVVSREFISSLTKSQLDLFIERSLDADGSRRENGYAVLYEAVEQQLDVLEWACILAGRSYKRMVRDPRGDISTMQDGRQIEAKKVLHGITVYGDRSTAMPNSRKGQRTEKYTGTVWCPRTPNKTWFARRNGKTFFTGNCEELILLMQVIRVITRSRMNAGALFVPDGVGTVDLEELLYNAANSPINDESAVSTIVPLLLQGPAELGKEIKLIDLSRRVDQELIDLTRRTTDRMLSGLDLPKELVSGLSGVKFANSIAITDEFFSAHVEPLVTMLCDAFTSVVMRPALRARGVSEDLLNRVVVWYDPSAIVTRPDKSAAANDGYDRKILSGESWRASRGFTELDAPDQDELIQRLAIEKAAIAPEMATTLIESLHPEFFAALREGNQEAAGMPEDISDILSGELPPGAPMPATPGEFDATQPETPGVPGPETPTPPGRPEESTDFQGGEITAPNGKQPPRRSAPR